MPLKKKAVKKSTAKKAPAKKAVAKKKPAVKKAPAKTTAKRAVAFEVSIHLPGSLPEKAKLKGGSTLSDLMEARNIDTGYTAFVKRGAESFSAKSTLLKKGDVIRVGVKTKNN